MLIQALARISSPGTRLDGSPTSHELAAKEVGAASMAAFQVFIDEGSQQERRHEQRSHPRVNCSSGWFLRQCVREKAVGRDCAVARESRMFLLLWQLYANLRTLAAAAVVSPSLKPEDDLGWERSLQELRSMCAGALVEAPRHAFGALGGELPAVGQEVPLSQLPPAAALPCSATLKTSGDVACFPVSVFLLHPSWLLVVAAARSSDGFELHRTARTIAAQRRTAHRAHRRVAPCHAEPYRI